MQHKDIVARENGYDSWTQVRERYWFKENEADKSAFKALLEEATKRTELEEKSNKDG